MSAALREVAATSSLPARFVVSIWAADGTRRDFERIGGCYVDHALEAIDALAAADEAGARIKVRQMSGADHG